MDYLLFLRRIITYPAQRFIFPFFAEQDEFFTFVYAVRELGQLAAADADGVYLGYVFRGGHERGQGTERLAHIIHIQPGHDHADAGTGKLVADFHESCIEKLGLVDAHHVGIAGKQENIGGSGYGRRMYGIRIVRNHFLFIVARIRGRLKNFDFLAGELRAFQPPDQLFGFAGKHGTADHLDRAAPVFMMNGVFEKHKKQGRSPKKCTFEQVFTFV
ncbi:MAG: hypothetical protein FD123_2093 [Bacteroidetes bacterium]|nr:MAG: hypothetical protein FD123_2093 [Bacteroidota bacterium]